MVLVLVEVILREAGGFLQGVWDGVESGMILDLVEEILWDGEGFLQGGLGILSVRLDFASDLSDL